MINEGNKQDEYLEKKGESSKTTAIRKAVGGGYVNEARVDDRLSADQKKTIRNARLSPGDRLPVRGETSRDTEERLTQKRRDRTRRDRGGQTVRGSKVSDFSGVSWQSPEKRSKRRSELRAKSAKNNIRDFREQKTFSEFMTEARRMGVLRTK